MEDLIKALQIFLKYGNPEHPTICCHDVLIIYGISPEQVSEEDKMELEKLGFVVNEENECFVSYRFGSA